MAQGWRGRVALVGAGVLFGAGLVGCMSDDKPIGTLPKAKGTAANTMFPKPATTVGGLPPGGSGVPGGATRAPVANDLPNTFRNPGTMPNTPALPGTVGTGAPIPGSAIPSVTPTGSNYTPTPSSPYPPTSHSPASPVSGYQVSPPAPVSGTGSFNPPAPELTDVQPPFAPTGPTPSVNPGGGEFPPQPPTPPPGATPLSPTFPQK